MRLVRIFWLIAFFVMSGRALAQTPVDSLQVADSLRRVEADSLSRVPPPVRDSIRPVLRFPFTSDSFLYQRRLFFSFTHPVRYSISEKRWEGKEVIFYSVVTLLLLFAMIKNSFRRYLPDLFSSYFQTTMRQRQIKEQLLQNPLPSLLFNIFFLLSGALFLSLMLEHFALAHGAPFWLLALYCAAVLAVVYTGKFLFLKFFGWVFRFTEAANTYLFIIFSTNKILGILFLPFIILLGFTTGNVNAAAATLGLIVVACMFLYRYFLSYISVNRMIRIHFFHFILYLAAFEILPLLLINKLLFLFLREIY